MNRAKAKLAIESVLNALRPLSSKDKKHIDSRPQGKLYELFVLARLVEYLWHRGFALSHIGTDIEFKQSPGKVDTNDPHFRVHSPHGQLLHLFVDIQFETLGHTTLGSSGDRSSYHELDIALIQDPKNHCHPACEQVLLAIECKSSRQFKKRYVREVLGLRRELSRWMSDAVSQLSDFADGDPVFVPAFPASELYLAYIDPRGHHYWESPNCFGVQFWHCQP